jgi:hypothetical protein
MLRGVVTSRSHHKARPVTFSAARMGQEFLQTTPCRQAFNAAGGPHPAEPWAAFHHCLTQRKRPA